MTTTTAVSPKSNSFPLVILGLLAAALSAGVLFGWTAPLGLSDRTAFIILCVMGLAMCGLSPLGKGAIYGWLNPLHLLGYAFGALGLVFMAAILAGWALPEALTVHSGVPALLGLMTVKVGISFLYKRKL